MPKATVLGVAEETSASIVTAINDEEISNSSHSVKKRRGVNTVVNDALFKQQDKLGHLTQAERSVMGPVLVKYRHTKKGVMTSRIPIWSSIRL